MVNETNPAIVDMTSKVYSPKEWLMYFRNTNASTLVAYTIDLDIDKALVAINPDEKVEWEVEPMKRQFVTVKDRVELRKIKIKQLLGMIGTIDAMIADERPFESVHWSEDSLKLDETMKPEAPNVNIGDACKIEETGEAGTWQKDDSGDFICVPNEIKSPFVPEAPEQSENAE